MAPSSGLAESAGENPATAPRMSAILRLGATDNITFQVGPENCKYVLHEVLLTHYSEYFRNALSGPWKEAEDKIITLEDIEPEVFNVFVDWLYTQELPAKVDDWKMIFKDAEMRPLALSVLKVRVFGDRFMIPQFSRAVHNQFVDLEIDRYCAPSYETVIYAFGNLPTKNLALKLLVDMHCNFWDTSLDEFYGETPLLQHLPNDFLVRVMYYNNRLQKNKEHEYLDRCSYHEHESEDEREECLLKIKAEDHRWEDNGKYPFTQVS